MADQSGQETKEILSPRKKRTKEIIELLEEQSSLRSLAEIQKQSKTPILVNNEGDSKIGLRILAMEAELKTIQSSKYLKRVRKEQAVLDNIHEIEQTKKVVGGKKEHEKESSTANKDY